MNGTKRLPMPIGINRGLTMPGPCESCGKKAPRFQFYNEYAEPEIAYKLCPRCMNKAMISMRVFFQTPAGAEAIKRRLLEYADGV